MKSPTSKSVIDATLTVIGWDELRAIPIRGRFYPACAEAPAQITLTEVDSQAIQSIWRVSPEGLQVLEKLGVPISRDRRSGKSE